QPLFHTVDGFPPLRVRQPLFGPDADMAVKECLAALALLTRPLLEPVERGHRIGTKPFETAGLDQLGMFPRMTGHPIPSELAALAADFTLRDHRRAPPGSPRPGHRTCRATRRRCAAARAIRSITGLTHDPRQTKPRC